MLDVEFVQLLQDMIGDLTSAPEPLVIKLFSQDPVLLKTWAPQVGEAIKKIPGVVDVLDGIENTISGPGDDVQGRSGDGGARRFTPQELELDASAIMQGEPAATPLVVNDRAYTIRVRFPESTRSSVDAIKSTLLVSSTGRTGTLGTLATVEDIPGQTEVRREKPAAQRHGDGAPGKRRSRRRRGGGAEDDRGSPSAVHDPRRVWRRLRGAAEVVQGSPRRPGPRGPARVHGAAVRVRRLAAPIAVVASALLSTVGVFAALLITRTTFNLSSFMGVIMVIGIVAKNGILLLDADQRYRAEGMSPEESMIHAGERRLRPIMMTALATVAGMIPLALGWAPVHRCFSRWRLR